MTFKPHRTTRVETLCACDIEGLPNPIGFTLSSLVRGLLVSYSLISKDEAAVMEKTGGAQENTDNSDVDRIPTLDFGTEVPLHSRRSLWLCIRNHSGIPTQYVNE